MACSREPCAVWPMTDPSHASCAVCGSPRSTQNRVSKVLIEGRSLALCRTHAATVAASRPATFDEMRALFLGVGADPEALLRRNGLVERRSPIERRDTDDRRAFPPRPEGRRKAPGRRASDPRE